MGFMLYTTITYVCITVIRILKVDRNLEVDELEIFWESDVCLATRLAVRDLNGKTCNKNVMIMNKILKIVVDTMFFGVGTTE